MHGIVRVFISGATGVFVSDLIAPQIAKVFRPDSDFAVKAVRSGIAGASTAIAWYAIGMFGGGAK